MTFPSGPFLRLLLSFALLASLLGYPRPARADELFRSLLESPRLGPALLSSGRVPFRVESAAAAVALGAVPITETWAVSAGGAYGALELEALGYRPFLGSPYRIKLDQAATSTFLEVARKDYGLDGAGVFVGLVDTGVSVSHPSLRRADGGTRIAWLLSFDRAPLGLHAALEEQYGCSAGGCAILAAADLDQLLTSGGAGLPSDVVGHGTHVASTAAGRDERYPGVAPGADLIVVQSGDGTGSLADGDILLGAKFIYDRAAEANRPVVVNLSLGSNFGSHDGASPLEAGLSELVTGPGKAMVVASGNEGSVYTLEGSALPEPLGSHTEAAVLEGGETHVALATAFSSTQELTAYVWISHHPDDYIEMAFQSPAGKSPFVKPGDTLLTNARSLGDRGGYEVGLLNGKGVDFFGDVPEGQAVFVMAGPVLGGERYELVFRGRGTVRLWLESAVRLDDGSVIPTAALFPRGRTSGTVAIPASDPHLIAVGASVNRNGWRDYTGTEVSVDGLVGGIATFSSAGPNQLGQIKPDLLAPGDHIIAAMSAEADPRTSDGASQFRDPGVCPVPGSECFVVDDTHAVSSGTSMAAPQVAGAVALLLQRDASLTQADIRALLRAGAKEALDEGYPSNWYGAGQLDIEGALHAQDRRAANLVVLPTRKSTRLALGNTFLYPDPTLSVRAFLLLRDDDNRAAGGFDPADIGLTTNLGAVRIVGADYGALELELSAPRDSGGKSMRLEVTFRGQALAELEVPIGVDPTAALIGYDVTGGCHAAGRPYAPPGFVGLGLVAGAGLLLALTRRRGAGAKPTPCRAIRTS